MDMADGRRALGLGDTAPDFRARSTQGDVQLSRYRGRWLLFFSHPADFTPVCSTEFAALARRQQEFDALNCSLLALSVDSLYAHQAWVKALEEVFAIRVPFPILEDPSMAIGRAYGMVDSHSTDSMAMRSTFFIDPDQVIRAVTCYPHNVGRSVDEMLRILKALQRVADGKSLAPEGWTEGQKLLRPAQLQPDGGPDWFCRYEDKP